MTNLTSHITLLFKSFLHLFTYIGVLPECIYMHHLCVWYSRMSEGARNLA